VGVQARAAILTRIFANVGRDMNRVIILESLLALAAVVLLGPGTSMLAREAAKQALMLVRVKHHRTPVSGS
jgi:hypothetical protein